MQFSDEADEDDEEMSTRKKKFNTNISNLNNGDSENDEFNNYYQENIQKTNEVIIPKKNTNTKHKVEKLRALWKNGRYFMHPNFSTMIISRKLKLIKLSSI